MDKTSKQLDQLINAMGEGYAHPDAGQRTVKGRGAIARARFALFMQGAGTR